MSLFQKAKLLAGGIACALAITLTAPLEAQAAGTHKFSEGTAPIYISSIQKELAEMGYYKGEPTGIMSDELIAAIKHFQGDDGIKEDGIADMSLVNRLRFGQDITPSKKATNPASDPWVLAIQKELSDIGYYTGSIDGLYGPKTKEAIVAYQAAMNLPDTGLASRELYLTIINNDRILGKKAEPASVTPARKTKPVTQADDNPAPMNAKQENPKSDQNATENSVKPAPVSSQTPTDLRPDIKEIQPEISERAKKIYSETMKP